MIKHPAMNKWDESMKKMFDAIDDYLEDKYGSDYPLHPVRPSRGETADKSSDGLFSIGASFSAGYGSELGRGYVVEVHMSTLKRVPGEIKQKVYGEVVEKIQELLPQYFKDRDLKVEKDGMVYKIYGDLSLGNV